MKELTGLSLTDLRISGLIARTTNDIKRAFREVRRANLTNCFNNTLSIERIVCAVISHLNEQWRIKPLDEFTQVACNR